MLAILLVELLCYLVASLTMVLSTCDTPGPGQTSYMALTEIVALIVLGFLFCLSKQHTLREVGSKLHHVMRSPIYLL